MVLNGPQVVEANLIGQLALFQGFLVQRVPVNFVVIGTLHFIQESKLHGSAPFRSFIRQDWRKCTVCLRGEWFEVQQREVGNPRT